MAISVASDNVLTFEFHYYVLAISLCHGDVIKYY